MRRLLLTIKVINIIILLFSIPALFSQEYAGSATCKMCHKSVHDNWAKSGHPYKLQKIENGLPPVFPAGLASQKKVGPEVDYLLKPGVPKPPKGYTWEQIGWTLGGYHSNARFLNREGYVILGDSAQYNLITNKWVTYTQKDPGTTPYTYSCYRCHVTGASKTKTNEFTAYPGIEGSWVETGVGCEACHGPSASHVSNFSNKPPKEGLATCNNCHARDRGEQFEWNFRVEWRKQTVKDIPTGFIRHREQGDMMNASKHGKAGLTCATCHDPHKGVYFELGGLKETMSCQTCHPNQNKAGHAQAECVDCHMPFAAKNGDVKTPFISEQSTHFWEIITEPITMFANLDTIGTYYFIKTDDKKMSGLTLDYTCLQCHVGKDVNWASSKAKDMHHTGVGVALAENNLPSAYLLAQNYPNPFNPVTTIKYSLPKASFVTINIYNQIGQLVQTLVSENLPGGQYSVEFDGRNLASGMYFYSIATDEFNYRRKMILAK